MEVKEIKTVIDDLDDFIEVPNGIDRLRNTILDLAVNGLLTEQKKSDGLAEDLYKDIQGIKEKSEKGNTNVKPLAPITDEEIPFNIPDNWKWVRLEDIFLVNPRNVIENNIEVSYIPMKTISSVWSVEPAPSEDKLWGAAKQGLTHVADNDVVLAKITPCFENLKSGVLEKLTNGFGVATTEVHVFRQFEQRIVPKYLVAFLKSHSFVADAIPKMTGTAGQKRVSTPYIKNQLFPLPPLAEQKRIVERVDELMKLIDQLELEKKERDEVRGKMAVSAFYSFGTEHNDFALKHLTELVKTPSDVDELEKSILSLAVSGKLTPQDPKDGNAEDLYQEIQKIKEKTETGKRKSKPLLQVSKDEVPFAVPSSWKLTRLAEVFDVRDGTHDTPKYVEEGFPLVTSKNLSSGRLNIDNVKYISEEDYLDINRRSQVEQNDILFAMIGSIGNPVLVDIKPEFSIKNVALFKYFDSKSTVPGFLLMYLKFAAKDIQDKSSGAVQSFVSLGYLRAYPFMLPPVNEQKRIVTKVDELMVMVQKLREVMDK